jgi:glyoxylase-like metal-dependent hydrolase (beta-lactamase superfamily II)
MIQINDNVCVETEYPLCNVGCVLTEKGLVLVDSPVLPQDTHNLFSVLSELSPTGIAYLVYTHEHFDHLIGGAHITNRIIAHQAVIAEIARLKTDLPKEANQYFPDIYREFSQVFDNAEISLPEIVFDDKLELYMGNKTLILFHAGGHSIGSVCIYIPDDKILFAGDNIVAGMPLVTPNSSFREWMDLLRSIQNMDITTIIPGHGIMCDKDTANKTLIYFETISNRVENLVKAGVGKEEIIDEIDLTDCLPVPMGETNAQSITLTITMLYDQLVKE